MEHPNYTNEQQALITNNFNKVAVKAQDNQHTIADMKAIIAYNQMQLWLAGKPYWVANPVKEKPVSTRVRVTCSKCGEVKSKCPYKAKERPDDCLAKVVKVKVDTSTVVVNGSYEEQLAKVLFKRMKKEELTQEELGILTRYEEEKEIEI